MKKWQQRLLLFAGMGLFIVVLISQSRKETPYSRRISEKYVEPFVQVELNGVIVAVRRTDLYFENALYGRRSLQFDYLDIKTNERRRLETGLDEPIQVGDTILKRKGENRFSLNRKGKGMFHISYPIDPKRQ